jgi:hypothetical protein
VAKKTQGDAVIVAGILKMSGADAISTRPRYQRAERKRSRVSNWGNPGGIKNVKSSLPIYAMAALQNLHVTLGALCGLATGPEFVRNCSIKTENICGNGIERKKKKRNERFHSSEFCSGRLKSRHRERTWTTATLSIAVDSGTGRGSDRHSCLRDRSRSMPHHSGWWAISLG